MKKINKFIVTGLFMAAFAFALSGCKDPQLTVTYVADGEVVDTLPSNDFYDVISVESDNENANAAWDVATWQLTTDELKKDANVTVNFEYTKFPFKLNGIGYETLQDAFNAVTDSNPVTINVTADYTGFGVTPVGSDITLNLNGHAIDGAGVDTITCNGTLNIEGEGTLTNSVLGEYSKSLVNYGTLNVTNVTITNTTENVSIWNSNNGVSVLTLTGCDVSRTETDAIVIINSGEMNIQSGNYTGTGDATHPVIYNNTENAVLNLNGGFITNNGEGYTVYRGEGVVNSNGAAFENAFGLE